MDFYQQSNRHSSAATISSNSISNMYNKRGKGKEESCMVNECFKKRRDFIYMIIFKFMIRII